MRVWYKTHRNYIILPLASDANGGMTDPARLSPPQAGFSGRISLRRRPAAASPGACLQKAFGPCFSAEQAGKAGKKACRQNLYHAFRRAGCPLRTRPHDAMISRAPAKEHRKRAAETRISTMRSCARNGVWSIFCSTVNPRICAPASLIPFLPGARCIMRSRSSGSAG